MHNTLTGFEWFLIIIAIGWALKSFVEAFGSCDTDETEVSESPQDKWELLWKLTREIDELRNDIAYNEGDEPAIEIIKSKIEFKEELVKNLVAQTEE